MVDLVACNNYDALSIKVKVILPSRGQMAFCYHLLDAETEDDIRFSHAVGQ